MATLHINIDLRKVSQKKLVSVLRSLATDIKTSEDYLDYLSYTDDLKDSKQHTIGSLKIEYSKFECEHEEFDDFSHNCYKCGLTPRDILDYHKSHCIELGNFKIDEDGGCSRCGMNIPLCEDLEADE